MNDWKFTHTSHGCTGRSQKVRLYELNHGFPVARGCWDKPKQTRTRTLLLPAALDVRQMGV